LPEKRQHSDSRHEQFALSAIAHSIPPDLQQGLEILLSQSADPQAAVLRLERFCDAHPAEFQQIAWTPFGLQALIAVFSSSEFLSEELLRHPGWLVSILGSGCLHRVRSTPEMEADLAAWIAQEDDSPDPAALSPLKLASFRRRQILRILVRDVLGFAGLPEITEELSNLADAIIAAACRRRQCLRLHRPRARQARRTRAELQLRHRPDVPVPGPGRHRRRARADQQGVL
jgi:glutamine synthetase adenylyltransferase